MARDPAFVLFLPRVGDSYPAPNCAGVPAPGEADPQSVADGAEAGGEGGQVDAALDEIRVHFAPAEEGVI